MNGAQQSVSDSHYLAWEYTNKRRFASFWHQIDEIVRVAPSNVLEIGVGSGFLQRNLRHLGIELLTVDIAPGLSPDCAASVISLPFADSEFDVSACFQVLEHMPYDQSIAALRELYRVTRRTVLISVPDVTPYVRFDLVAPRVNTQRFVTVRSYRKRTKIRVAREHYWELGVSNLFSRQLIHDIKGCGFAVVKHYRVPENPYHHFFVLAKPTEDVQ